MFCTLCKAVEYLGLMKIQIQSLIGVMHLVVNAAHLPGNNRVGHKHVQLSATNGVSLRNIISLINVMWVNIK